MSSLLGSKYSQVSEDLKWHRNRVLTSPERFQPITSRKDTTVLELQQMKGIAKGKYLGQYRGFTLLKTALDLSLYSEMFQDLQPKSIIEFGTFTGSSALWMDDMLRLFGIDCKIYTVDKYVSFRDKKIEKLVSNQVTFIEGDSHNVEELFPASFFKDLPRPLLVIDDAHENVDGILKHFHNFFQVGDYFCIEDTNPIISRYMYVGEQDPSTYREGSLVKPEYVEDGFWKLEIVRRFFTDLVDFYSVDTFFTDFNGLNGSLQMNSIFRKMK